MNKHIESYLDYYCSLSHSPGFAVLLKGEWGSGKTWFIKKYTKKLKDKKSSKNKILYVSLYGITEFSEIEYSFFQQLHPFLSSKGVQLTSKILKAFVRGTLNIDLNRDGNNDGTATFQTFDIKLPEYLKNTDKSILIFDDLERCRININDILGYINSFVEHQELKVILVANEDELTKANTDEKDKYLKIKEKLIGQTFDVTLDLESALQDFIGLTYEQDVKDFLTDKIEFIENEYIQSGHKNLRTLKQIILDFERIYQELPEEARNYDELILDTLEMLIALSIKIRKGETSPQEILKKLTNYKSARRMQPDLDNTSSENDTQFNRKMFRLYNKGFCPSPAWWETFFDKGYSDTNELEQSINNSVYFRDKNTPNWIKLWYFSSLSDSDFENLVTEVEQDFYNHQYTEIGVIKHITGLFLQFSDAKIYKKSKSDILIKAKEAIDYLKQNYPEKLSLYLSTDTIIASLRFRGTEFDEFEQLCFYIEEVKKSLETSWRTQNAKDLLEVMKTDVNVFDIMICPNHSQSKILEKQLERKYYDIPILKYIDPYKFIEEFMNLNIEDKTYVFMSILDRYNFGFESNFIDELDWLKSIRELLQQEADNKVGKLSSYNLEILIKEYLNESIKKLEAI